MDERKRAEVDRVQLIMEEECGGEPRTEEKEES